MIVKIDEISKKIAEKLNMDPNDVRLINRAQWKLLHGTMQSGTLEPVSIIYLGKFSKKIRNSDEFKKRARDLKRIQESDL